jgi:glycosyltransferase involved in cell wall biosynthesis
MVKDFFSFLNNLGFFFIAILCAFFYRNKPKKYIVFGPTPIISYSYWANALKEIHPDTITLMSGFYGSINDKKNYDLYFEDLVPKALKKVNICHIRNFFALLFLLKNAKLFVTCYDSAYFKDFLKPYEILLLRIAKVKTVLIGYGSDIYMYSRIRDISFHHALQLSYPLSAIHELKIQKNVEIKNKYADFVIVGFASDGLGRWDLLTPQPNVIDEIVWNGTKHYKASNGYDSEVIISHSTNHRAVKGTEFIVNAVEELRQEGLKIKFNFIEKKKNVEVKEIIEDSDIFIEQLIINNYALSALEAMSKGLPVIANLSNDFMTSVFRRYSFLNECPIVSATPETITDVLRVLITNPKLREELGRAGRQYVEKYHSYKTAQYMFGAIYDKLINNKDVDLMNLFHPLLSDYNRSSPYVKHPLQNNQLPERYFKETI